MGFKELIESGQYKTSRITVAIPPGQSFGGPITGVTSELGSTYILLGISATKECRVRLYSTSESIALDSARAPLDFTIDPDVGLNLEAYLTSSQLQLTFDPPVIGTAFDGSNTWLSVSSSAGSANVQVVAYPIDDQTISRETLIVTSSVSTGIAVSGSVVSPKSFMILGATSDFLARLRLYSTTLDDVPTEEKIRVFGVQPPTGSKLIADLVFDSASFFYKINPVLEGYTWAGGQNYSTGTNVVHYILENLSGTSPAPVTASLEIISLED